MPGAVDVDSNLIVGNPEVHVEIDRDRAGNLGVDVADVANALELLVGGLKVSTYQEAGNDYDIRARAEAEYRADLAGISAMTVQTKTGKTVPLSSVVRLVSDHGPVADQPPRAAAAGHHHRQRRARASARARCRTRSSRSSTTSTCRPSFTRSPPGSRRRPGARSAGFAVAVGLSFIFMYLVLAAQFGSWLHPITIMLSLPLTVPFALLSLLLFEQELSLLSMLGIIVLFGVVKKNAILQVDHTNHLRAEGRPRLDAILEANRDRLRPILMTTLAFVAGMIPLITSRGIGAGLEPRDRRRRRRRADALARAHAPRDARRLLAVRRRDRLGQEAPRLEGRRSRGARPRGARRRPDGIGQAASSTAPSAPSTSRRRVPARARGPPTSLRTARAPNMWERRAAEDAEDAEKRGAEK